MGSVFNLIIVLTFSIGGSYLVMMILSTISAKNKQSDLPTTEAEFTSGETLDEQPTTYREY